MKRSRRRAVPERNIFLSVPNLFITRMAGRLSSWSRRQSCLQAAFQAAVSDMRRISQASLSMPEECEAEKCPR